MIYTITSTLPKEHGGRTKSLLQRINLLKQQLNIDNVILTTNYNIEYPEIQKHFSKKAFLIPLLRMKTSMIGYLVIVCMPLNGVVSNQGHS